MHHCMLKQTKCFIGTLQACMGTQISGEEKQSIFMIAGLLFLLVVGNPGVPLPHVHTLYKNTLLP